MIISGRAWNVYPPLDWMARSVRLEETLCVDKPLRDPRPSERVVKDRELTVGFVQ